jgi:CDP-2,3-bis-(O-geranylgeranyl)-sn-glycerol synthase
VLILSLLGGLLIYLPALAANGGPTFVRKGTPIDGGRKLGDGNRVLGDGKTYEGLLLGLTFGTLLALGEARFLTSWWVLAGFLESLGALCGDMVGAFAKRRMGLERGARVPLLDQLDFILGSTAALIAFGVRITILQFVFVSLLVIALHVLTNIAAFKLGIKNVPW